MKTSLSEDSRETGLEDLLTWQETRQYLRQIGLEPYKPSLEFLTQIIEHTYATIPFQNLTMLTRPRTAPNHSEIVEDMLSGIGGACTTLNPFICGLLQTLGFEAGLVMASMTQPDCHFGILVDLEKQRYWVDIGNGFPYLQPLRLQHQAEGFHPYFQWRLLRTQRQLTQTEDQWSVEQQFRGNGIPKINQSFNAFKRHYRDFQQMRERHYSEASYGPFLTGIRVNRWNREGGHVLRNQMIWDLPGKQIHVDLATAIQWLQRHFGEVASQLTPLLKTSWHLLEME